MKPIALVLSLALFPSPFWAQSVDFIRGDCNRSGEVTVADVVFLSTWFFIPGGGGLLCYSACDANDDDQLNLVDTLDQLNMLFDPGALPFPAPFPNCGSDPTPQTLTCSSFDCSAPVPLFPDPDYVVTLTSHVAPVGFSRSVNVQLDNVHGSPLSAWSWGVCHDPDFFELAGVEDGADLLTARGGKPAHFIRQAEYPRDGWTAGVLVDLLGQYSLPPRSNHVLHRATYELLSPGISTLDFCEQLGDPIVPIRAITWWSVETRPTTHAGTIEILAEPIFRRGDANGDGLFNGLSDALFAFSFGFIPGSPAPPCFDAIDADGDSNVNGLLDGLFILNFQFIPGSPPPPPPGPFECGPDPTPDNLGCTDPGDCRH